MKQQLWIVNSSLIGIFIMMFALAHLLHHDAPMVRTKKLTPSLPQKEKE